MKAMRLLAVIVMKSKSISLRLRPGTREKADAIQARFAGYGDNLTDLIHLLIDREYERLTRPEKPLLWQIDSHARAIQLLIQSEAERQGWAEESAEIDEILSAAQAAESRTE